LLRVIFEYPVLLKSIYLEQSLYIVVIFLWDKITISPCKTKKNDLRTSTQVSKKDFFSMFFRLIGVWSTCGSFFFDSLW